MDQDRRPEKPQRPEYRFVIHVGGATEGEGEFDRLRGVGASQTSELNSSRVHPTHISLDGRVDRSSANGNGANGHSPTEAIEQPTVIELPPLAAEVQKV